VIATVNSHEREPEKNGTTLTTANARLRDEKYIAFTCVSPVLLSAAIENPKLTKALIAVAIAQIKKGVVIGFPVTCCGGWA